MYQFRWDLYSELIFMNQLQVHYYTRILRQFARYLRTTDKILDVGCGDGLWASLLSSKVDSYIGVDVVLSPQWKELPRGKVDFILADGSCLPFRKNSFDVVFEKDTLHHVDEVNNFLTEMKRVCKRIIVIVEGNRYNPISWLWMVKIRGHEHFSYSHLSQLVSYALRDTVIKISQVEAHYIPIPLNTKIISIAEELLEDMLGRILGRPGLCNYNVVVAVYAERQR